MNIDEIYILEDRGFVFINGEDAKDFLQNIITKDINTVTDNNSSFASILTPQGKYLVDFFIIKQGDGYLLDCEKSNVEQLTKIFSNYKLRSKVNFNNESNNYAAAIISKDKFISLENGKNSLGFTIQYRTNPIFMDPRNELIGARLISSLEKLHLSIKKLNLKIANKDDYYNKCYEIGIPEKNLNKLKEKIFGIENNLEELNALDFKKGCYVGQENTSRIKLRSKLRRRLLPVKLMKGKINENEVIKFQNFEVGRILIDQPYPFAIVKLTDPNINKFLNENLQCESGTVKIFAPKWLQL
ncbi:MAG TPA: folate-binding protein [Pelagibacteraceae bacterium]|nr:folate-binding protein [Pelagibacteraceae bacterium]